MTPTSTPVTMVVQMVSGIPQMLAHATAQAYRMIWNAVIPELLHNWLTVIIVLFVFLLFSIAVAAISGRWGMLGSVLYHYLYYGFLFLIGLIWGPEVFANDYFDIVLTILYLVCYSIVGVILVQMGYKRRWR